MLQEVQELIKKIEDSLNGNPDFETVVSHGGTVITVHPRNGEPTVYHGYELHLLDVVVKHLGNELLFSVIQDGDAKRFMVTTEASYNLTSYINSTNLSLRELQSDEINTVFLCEQVSSDGRGQFTLLTGYTTGVWSRYDLTKSELIYAAVFGLRTELNENGIYWYPELVEMNRSYCDELEAFEGDE